MLGSDWSNHAMLFVAYVYGFMLAGEPWLGTRIDAEWPRALAAGIASTLGLVMLTWMDVVPFRLPAAYSLPYLAFWALYAIGAWSWMVAILGLARRFLRSGDGALRYGREIGYGWYLAHQPVIVAIAFLVVAWRASVASKFGVLFAASFVGTLGATELLRRARPLGFVLGLQRPDDLAPSHPAAVRGADASR
jgi:glucans biosynthesis protein C